MRVEYDREMCASFHLCVPEWDVITEPEDGNKIEIKGTIEENGIYSREIPPDEEDAAIAAAKACPVDAIAIYDDDDRLVP